MRTAKPLGAYALLIEFPSSTDGNLTYFLAAAFTITFGLHKPRRQVLKTKYPKDKPAFCRLGEDCGVTRESCGTALVKRISIHKMNFYLFILVNEQRRIRWEGHLERWG